MPRTSLLIAAVALLLSVSPAVLAEIPAPSSAPSPPSSAAPAAASAGADLSTDARLGAPVNFSFLSGTLEEFCDGATKARKVSLRVASEMRGRRATLLAKRMPLRTALAAVARVAGGTWYAEGDGYLLQQSPDDKKREEKQISASERRERAFMAKRRSQVDKLLREAIAGRDPNKPSFADMLATLPPDQLRLVGETTHRPRGMISAVSNAGSLNRIVGVKPFGQWPPAVQQQIQKSVQGMAARGFTAPPGDVSQAQIGIVCAHQVVGLGVINAAGDDVWFSPTDLLVLPAPDLEDAQMNDFDPSVVAQLEHPNLVAIRNVPPAIQRTRLRFGPKVNRKYLSTLLDSVAEQTGLTIAADDPWRTRATREQNLLRDKDEYSLKEALLQIAQVFGHKMQYRDGVLFVETLTPGLDLRAEPPAQLLDRLQTLAEEKKRSGLDEYLDVARLSLLQVITLARFPPEKMPRPVFFASVQWMYAPWHLYAGLTPEQREQAETDDGLARDDLTPSQQREFDVLAGTGPPSRAAAALTGEPAGRKYLSVERKRQGEETTGLSLRVVGSTAAEFRLTVP